jgi:hypothetical protein
LLGALPRSYQVTPDIPTGDERHSESQSGQTADSVKASQLAAGRTLPSTPDVTAPIQTASGKAGEITTAPMPENRPFAGDIRTERDPFVLLAMQKVVGSNPISRSPKGLHLQVFFVGAVGWCVCIAGHPMGTRPTTRGGSDSE